MKWIKNRNWSIFIIAFIVFFIWQTPSLGSFRYPFMLLGTWFHEMGHGLTAILVGGDFKYLEIYQNGGGVAYSTVTNKIFSIPTASALTAAGGLLGPAFAGAVSAFARTVSSALAGAVSAFAGTVSAFELVA